MFGYVQANTDKLSGEEAARYRAVYCGICKSIRERYRFSDAFVLQYDMAFLVILLSAIEGGEEIKEMHRCVTHPVKKHEELKLAYSDYAADMNLLLAYYNCLDDWADDKNLIKLSAAKLLERDIREIEERWPVQAKIIKEKLDRLSYLEKHFSGPDETARCFGEIMRALFLPKQDMNFAEELGALGFALGQFIYLMDASLDLKEDLKHCRYNPLTELVISDHRSFLNMFMGDATEAFEQISLKQDEGILRNILYSGVWSKYAQAQKENGKKEGGQS